MSVRSGRLSRQMNRQRTGRLHRRLRLISNICPGFSIRACHSTRITPMFFNSTLGGFNIRRLLSYFIRVTPSPGPAGTRRHVIRPRRPGFANFVFGVATGVSPGRHSYVTFYGVYSNGFIHGRPCCRMHLSGAMHFSSPARFVTRHGDAVSRTCPNSVINLPSGNVFGVNSALARNRGVRFHKLPSFSPLLFGCVRGSSPVGDGRFRGNLRRLVGRNITRLFVGRFGNHHVINAINRLRFRIVRCHLRGRCGTGYH